MSEMGIQSARGGRAAYGCFFCRSGIEERIIAELRISAPELYVISPKKIRIRRMGSEAHEEQVTLFPGYLFFRASGSPDFRKILAKQDVYRLLQYPSGDWTLTGADRAIAEMMFASGGVIGLSRAYYEGESVRIAEGPLKDVEGAILRLNKRAKTAQVKLDFVGKSLVLWLGYEIIETVSK